MQSKKTSSAPEKVSTKVKESKSQKGISTASVDILNPTKVPEEKTAARVKPIGEPIIGNGLHTIKNGANRISDCAMANETIRSALEASSSSFSYEEVLDILGGLETDFNCASLCKRSPLYAFSKVNRGPPPQTCRRSFNAKMSHFSTVFFWSSVVFGFITFVGFILATMITFDKRGELDEPLLQR